MTERFTPPDWADLKHSAESFGKKFTAQKLFYEFGMCGIETRLFEPQFPTEKIARVLNELNIENRGVTVRFSFKDTLNLPRGFFNNRQKCIDFISNERKNYAVIVQEYTHLVNSFELYSDGSLSYLQVLPGIWEVDTNEPPDIIREKDGELTFWRFDQSRKAKLVNSDKGFYTEERFPFSFEQLKEFHKKLEPYKERLEMIRKMFNPFFCHFYEDNQGRFCFINIRDVGVVPINEDSPSFFHVVKNSSNIDTWDGSRPILFDVHAERNNNFPLTIAINSLKSKGVKTVFVNYGILSHPAILLREAGIHVQQSYTLYEKRTFAPNETEQAKLIREKSSAKGEAKTKIQKTDEDFSIHEKQPAKNDVIRLGQITSKDFTLVGNKAYNLNRLIERGFWVPKGFVITTQVFNEWFKQEEKLPARVVDRIFEECRNLNLEEMAVRSSAIAEDMNQASYAGIYKTTLNINTKKTLINAIIEGFQSFHNPSTLIYQPNTLSGGEKGIALIVQEMVNADTSGVLFTHNLSDGRSDEFIINSTFGLGEFLVSGRVPGDTYTVSDKGEVLETIITEKETALTINGERNLGKSFRSKPSLEIIQIKQLVQIGKAIEELFNSPQDIEFAIKDNQVWILQSRPITARLTVHDFKKF